MEILSAVVSGFASKFAEVILGPIRREISYVFNYQSNVEELRTLDKELAYKREMVEQPVIQARRQGDEIYKRVEDWLNNVDDFTEDVVKSITGGEDEAKKRCFKGLCPNLIKRYSLGKKAVKAAKEGADLLGTGNFGTVSFRPTVERTTPVSYTAYEQFDSRMKIFQNIMEVLKDTNVGMIGVYGVNGVGKTTLVKQIAMQVIEDKLFDKVVFVEVTQTPDLQTIQNKLSSDLELEFKQNENVFQRAEKLRQRLKNVKRVLVILDNIWKLLNLDAVGIPFGDVKKERNDDRSRCTVLLTSRNRDVLCNDMNSQKFFLIEVLSYEEAWCLFEKIVGDSAKASDFRVIADEIVRRCGGLPVAIKTIANALKNKRLYVWNDSLERLRNSTSRQIHGMEENVYSSIELSYSFLKSEEEKSMFRLCALRKDGSPIPIDDLMRYGIGLGLFSNVRTSEAARNRVYTLVDNLKASSLLLDGDKDEVKLHDIIYAVAVSIARDEFMFNIQSKDELKDKIQKDSIAISLPNRDIDELPERLECPKLSLFLLFAKYDNSLKIPDLFFEGMNELRVVHFTRTCFLSLPSSLVCLINLRTLSLEGCQVGDVAIVGQLKKLEILSFRNSDIQQLPREIGQLVQLRLLDLRNCRRLQAIAPNVISKLSRLEELYMGDSFSQWEKVEGGSNASLVELKGLSKLTTLEIHIRDARIMPQDLISMKLEIFRMFIGNVVDWYHKFERSRLVKLDKLEKNILLGQGMKMFLKRTEDLYLHDLKGFQNVVHELDDGEVFSELKHLHVEHSYEILHIVSSIGQVCCKVFPLLESLSLCRLFNLEKICHNRLHEDESFSNLRIIKVGECDKLRHLFSFSMAKNLLRLQKISVFDCKSLEIIVGLDMEKQRTTLGFNGITTKDDPDEKHLEICYCWSMEGVVETNSTESRRDEGRLIEIVFPKLLYLRLIDLPKLMGFSIGIHSVEFPSLLELQIDDCPNMKRFISISSSQDNIHANPQPLFDEKVGTPNLMTLRVSYCHNIEEIIRHVGEDVKENRITFNQLKNLELDDLPSLTSFCLGNCTLEFPSLERVFVRNCRNMKTFSEGVVGFHDIKDLKLSQFPHLKEIWHGQALNVSIFSNLRSLGVDNCTNMSSAIPANLLRCLNNLERLKVRNCDSLEEVFHLEDVNAGEHFGPLFPKLYELELIDLPKLKRFCNFTWNIIELLSLSSLWIENCPNMETFISNSTSINLAENMEPQEMTSADVQPLFDEKVALPILRQLTIICMDNLKIWQEKLTLDSFCNLYYLRIENCNKLSNIFPWSMLERLQNLDDLRVVCCDSVQEIFELRALNGWDTHNRTTTQLPETIPSFVFPQLTFLILRGLPRLKSFYPGVHISEWPVLKKLVVWECAEVELLASEFFGLQETPANSQHDINVPQPLFSIYKIGFRCLEDLELSTLPKLLHLWKGKSKLSQVFQNLTTLDVSICDGLINLVTLAAAESLVKLARMKIAACGKMEKVIQQVGAEVVEEDSIATFNQLQYLGIDCLPSLTCFCFGRSKNKLEFPSLEQVVVRECPNMEMFSQGILETPTLHKLLIGVPEEQDDSDDDDDDQKETEDNFSRKRVLKTPKLRKVLHWEGNLNSIPQQFFKDIVRIN
ncbi:Disease resistance protein [Citrus sinensis]|uniref:Disease resistance protein n=1 Tax=Citrus sinensis TaxID=2711 RepID=A0ACB8JSZ5_CITSI|nr:Disease resistance protein [Citrus sinensis]